MINNFHGGEGALNTSGWADESMDGRMNQPMDGWMDGSIRRQIESHPLRHLRQQIRLDIA